MPLKVVEESKKLGVRKNTGREVALCLGDNLRRFRQMRGWTQNELATRAGLSQGFLQSLEAGRRWVGPATIRVLAEELEITQSELFHDGEMAAVPDKIVLLRWLSEALKIDAPDEFWKKLRLGD